ncbi:MAG: hypothetical protein IKQ82_04505, partial [Lentisphaeria bacterium]|nr:hypothetical protein [Lentisphaeria bacterium]
VWFSNPGYYVLQYLDTSGFAINDDDGTVTLRLWNHSETLYPNDDGEYPFVLSGTLASPSGTTIVFTSGAIVDSANYVNQVIVSGAIVLNSSGRKRESRWHNDARVSNGHFLLSGGQVTSSDEDQFVSSAFGKVEYAQARASIVCGGRLSSGGSEIVHEEELSLAAGGIYYKVTAGGVTKQGNLLDLVNAAANNR